MSSNKRNAHLSCLGQPLGNDWVDEILKFVGDNRERLEWIAFTFTASFRRVPHIRKEQRADDICIFLIDPRTFRSEGGNDDLTFGNHVTHVERGVVFLTEGELQDIRA